MTLKYDKLLKHIREKDGEVRSFLDEAELETTVGNYVGELVFVEPDKIFVRDGNDWNLVGGSGNPFDFLQLKTDYTPTGSEVEGVLYWKEGYPNWVTEDGLKSLNDYEKLAIPTTQNALYTDLIPNNKLIPNQWYLITDLDIYVQADTVNKLRYNDNLLNANSYMEYTEVGGNITQVNYWTDSGKGTKLFTKDIAYSGNNPMQIVMKDEITNTVLTTTIAYSGNTITNITKVLS